MKKLSNMSYGELCAYLEEQSLKDDSFTDRTAIIFGELLRLKKKCNSAERVIHSLAKQNKELRQQLSHNTKEVCREMLDYFKRVYGT